jgi:hypothetical protein
VKHARLLVSTLVVPLAILSLGVATAWLSDSGTFHHTITAAESFSGSTEKVWVCKLVGPPDDPHVAEGKNPIHVSANSVDADDAASDDHPSYVAEDGEVECKVPAKPGSEENVDEEVQAESEPEPSQESDGVVESQMDETTERVTTDPGALEESPELASEPTGTNGDPATPPDG